jgi:Rnl2 family RNA ligase
MKSAHEAWNFSGYEKIAERLEDLGLDEAAHRALNKLDWVVTEKVHGANFALVTDGASVRAAKRKALLEAGEEFFGYESVLGALESKVRDAFVRLKRDQPSLERMAFHGELFGGSYPHPDVPAVEGVQPVQTGVHYAPGIGFYAFDVALETPKGRSYLDYDAAMKLFESLEIFYARPLRIARFTEAVAYPLGFESHVPGWLGLPPLPRGNLAEGVVIKPVKSAPIKTTKGLVRPILKRKIVEFAEDERFHQAQKWTRPRANHESTSNTSSLSQLQAEVTAMMSQQRLDSAISKSGPLRKGDAKRARELFHLMVADLFAELEVRLPDELPRLSKSERQTLYDQIESDVRTLIKSRFGAKS